MPTLSTLQATIAAGASLSSAVDCADDFVVGLIMPAVWTPARVSLLGSVDNANWYDMFNFSEDCTTATEFKFNVTPGVMIAVNPDTTLMARYFKLRSGTRDQLVPQEAARVFSVIIVNRVAL